MPEHHHSNSKIATTFDEHDYEQLKMLAKLNRIKLPELVRRICKAHLDKSKINLAHERIEP